MNAAVPPNTASPINSALSTSTAWQWVWRYVLVIVVVLVIATLLSGMGLFKSTAAVAGKLTAAHIVKFLGYGGALAVLWLLARRASEQLRAEQESSLFLAELFVPLATLIAVSAGHGVLQLVLKPFMNADLRNLYNWLFVIGTLASATWLALTLFGQSPSWAALAKTAGTRLDHALRGEGRAGGPSTAGAAAAGAVPNASVPAVVSSVTTVASDEMAVELCSLCSAANSPQAKFCNQCGRALG
jgi:hypothetical protein